MSRVVLRTSFFKKFHFEMTFSHLLTLVEKMLITLTRVNVVCC